MQANKGLKRTDHAVLNTEANPSKLLCKIAAFMFCALQNVQDPIVYKFIKWDHPPPPVLETDLRFSQSNPKYPL